MADVKVRALKISAGHCESDARKSMKQMCRETVVRASETHVLTAPLTHNVKLSLSSLLSTDLNKICQNTD